MTLRNKVDSYGVVAKLFHWLMLVLLVSMLAVGFLMTGMENSPAKFSVYGIHKSVGAIVLLLVLLRLWWRLVNVSPELPESLDQWQKIAAHANHWALYALMMGMPLSGWAMSSAAGFPVSVFGWFTLPNLVAPDKGLLQLFRQSHEIIAYVMIITVLLHVTAALLHHFYYRDNILKRMLPFKWGRS